MVKVRRAESLATVHTGFVKMAIISASREDLKDEAKRDVKSFRREIGR